MVGMYIYTCIHCGFMNLHMCTLMSAPIINVCVYACVEIYIRLNLEGKKGHQTRTALTNVCVWKVCWHCISDSLSASASTSASGLASVLVSV